MGLFSRNGLKSKFSPKGKKPTVQDFADLIDSQLNVTDDNHRIGLKEHNENTVYQVGDTCVYESKLFKAIGQTSGEFNPAKWAEIELNLWEVDGEGLIKPKNSNKIDASHIDNMPTDKYGYYVTVLYGFYIVLHPLDIEATVIDWSMSDGVVYKMPSLDEATNLTWIDVANNNLKELIIPSTLVALTYISVENNKLTEFIIPPTLVALTHISVADNNLAEFVIPSTLAALTNFRSRKTNITNLIIPVELINLVSVDIGLCYLTQESVDLILVNLDSTGATNGQLYIDGPDNSLPTGGFDNPNFLSLVAKGWSIYTS